MPWSGGNYTKWNGAGGWTADAAANIGIEAGRHDDQDVDFQNGIDACLNKNGQNSMTNDLNLGGNKITNVDNAAVSTDAVTLGQVQAGVDIQSTSPFWTVTRFSNDVNGGVVGIRKSRGATVGTNTIVQNGDVLGAVQFYGANGTSYDAGADIVSFVDGNPSATNDMPGNLVFRTTPDGSATLQERMRITNGGFVGINDTNPVVFVDCQRDANDSLTRIRVKNESAGSSAVSIFQLGNNTNDSAVTFALQSSANTSNAGANSLYITNGLATIRIRAGGSGGVDLAAGATSWAAVSDERFKKNVQPLEYGIDQILALNPIRFDYTEDETNDSARLGFIAQDVQTVIPEAVKGSLETQLTLSATELIPALINAIKQLEARVAALEA